MYTRADKKLYEGYLGREVCDQTWYRLTKTLKDLNIEDRDDKNGQREQALKALILLASLKKNHEKMPILKEAFLEVWQIILKFDKEIATTSMKCEDFKVWLIKGLKHEPPKSQVYRWFSNSNCPYRQGKVYPLSSLVCVAAFAYLWQWRKIKRIESKLTEEILEGEIL